jgi:ABC-2 type transport system permease protein
MVGNWAGNIRYLWALLTITFKSAASQRGAMMLRGLFAVITHVFYFPVWYVMFSYAPSIGGWTLPHAFLAYGISICSWGIVALTMFGLRTLPQQIDNGELDSYLTLPKPVLLSAALSSSRNSGLGELLAGIGFMTFAGFKFHLDLTFMPLIVFMSSIVFASGILFFASFGFWLKQFYASAEEIYFNYNLMSSRPAPIFTGMFKIISLTIIPIGFMTHIPIEFIMTHQFRFLALSMLGTIGYSVFAITFFNLGLKYYESGNRFGVRG